MILHSETITTTQQEDYIERITNGEFTPEMQEELATIFENEVKRLDGKIEMAGAALAGVYAEHEAEWQKVEPEDKKLLKEHINERDSAIAECYQECDQAEKEAEQTVEKASSKHEQAEADSIRENLKKEE